MLIKVCGITDIPTAQLLCDLGIDMLGFVFVKTSPRLISLNQALRIRKIVLGRIEIVAVFQNQPLLEVQEIVNALQPKYIQLHGQENPAYCSSLLRPVIKAFSLGETAEETALELEQYKDVCKYFLVDRKKQGQGPLVESEQVHELSKRFSILLSGGLTPENISAVLKSTRNSIVGIDVSGGVEDAPGKKSSKEIKEFVLDARR